MTLRALVVAACMLSIAVLTSCSVGADAGPHANPGTGSGAGAASFAASTPGHSVAPMPSASTSTSAKAIPTIPPLTRSQRAVGFVDVRSVVPDAIIDLRYATTNNFTHVRLYPKNARCLIHKSMAAALHAAAAKLRAEGYLLVFWDCYRPHSVQVRMWQVVPNPNWVAAPGPYSYSHEAGRSVDVTLARRTAPHHRLDMGTGFDDFTSRAYAYATAGLSSTERKNRATLRTAMQAGGLTPYWGEWWHFDGAGASVKRPIINVPVN